MTVIILSIVVGILLLGLEIFILPGFITGLVGLAACGFGVYTAFAEYGNTGGFISLAIVFVLSVIIISFGLRARTWKRLSLKANIDGSSQVELSKEEIAVGEKCFTATRLAPVGKIIINGKTYEAKSQDVYIDRQKEVEIVGFDNFTVVVKLCKPDHDN